MYYFIVSALILASSIAEASLPSIAGCASSKLNSCTLKMVEIIGEPLQTSNVWLDPIFFNDILEQKMIGEDNMDNVAKICNGLQVFYACLGPYISNCLSVKGLTTVKQLDPRSAYSYIGYLNMWRFQCGAGFYALEKTSSLGCVQNTMKNQFKKLNELVSTYRSNIEHTSTLACQEAKKLEDSFRQIYAAGKCKDENKADLAGWWACEGQKEYTEAEFRECSHENKCDFTNPGKKLDKVKFVGDKMLVKIGPTWKKTETGEWYQEPEKWI